MFNVLRKFSTSRVCLCHRDLKLVAGPNGDILMHKFKHASSTRNILETVGDHEKIMNSKHIMQALRALFHLQKEGKSEFSTKDIIRNRNFIRLCTRLKYTSGIIDINETIEALKIVTYVGVPKDSTIVNVLLQLIRDSINELSLNNIMFLEFLLQHYSSDGVVPLADALKLALPIVFEIQLPVKMEGNLSNLKEYLYYATRNKLSEKTLDLILQKMLVRCREGNEDVQTAKSIVWSLSDLTPNEAFEPLLKANIETMLVHVDELSWDDLDMTLSKLSRAYRREFPFFSNRLLCDAIVSYLIDNRLGFEQTVYTMRKLDHLEVTNKHLIDYASKQLLEDESLLGNLYGIYILMKYVSKSDYRPPVWNELVQNIEQIEVNKKCPKINWLKFAAATCYLRIFNEGIIRVALDEDLGLVFRKRRNYFYLFTTMYHSIKLYRPLLLKLVPRNMRPRDFIQCVNTPSEFPLQGALYHAFGGEKYVNTGLFCKEGIYVDHTVVFRKGGYPVAVQKGNTKTFIEDLEISPENDIVTVLCLTPEMYTQENHLKIGPTVSIKVLEDLGYIPVPICWKNWNNLADYEKIPYIVRSVNEKLEQTKYVDINVQN